MTDRELLIDRLEVAEKDIALKEKLIDALGLGLNAAAHERDNLRAELADLRSSMTFRTSLIGRIEAERDALRARVEAMEKQEPVSHEFQDRNGTWHPFIDQGHYKNTVADGSWPIRALYLAPGAKGE